MKLVIEIEPAELDLFWHAVRLVKRLRSARSWTKNYFVTVGDIAEELFRLTRA